MTAEPSSLQIHQRKYYMWMLSHVLDIPNTPMYVGYSSKIFLDKSMKQRVSYLTTINLSPTNNAVVKETMVQASKIATECNEEYIQVTYDLAIAKIALQIQSQSNEFQNLFIHIGTFHVMMAFFKAIGKFIDNCGISNIMVDSELMASGSINGFITGKHFNRCKRLHPILSLAFSTLHFRQFLKVNGIEISSEIQDFVIQYNDTKSESSIIECEALLQIVRKYEKYLQRTMNGEHGKTARYYMIYVNIVSYYFLLNTSIRTADFALFKSVLPNICNLFFTFNQPNYARWLVRYHNNLCHVDETHPGLRKLFEKGSFGIKRTDKSFSRQPIGLTLEQTINADAANKLTGILHMTNSAAARQRWCKSHSIRSTIISHVMQEAGLSKRQDVTADLEKNRIAKNKKQLDKFIAAVLNNLNPFDENVEKESLFNISNGQAAKEDIEKFLLSIEKCGELQRESFVKECEEDPYRFEKPIKRNKMLTFTEALKKKKVVVNGKIQELRMQRDLFGRLLAVSLEQHIDLEKVLSFPLTPVPLSLCHLDGTMCKTDKSVLLKCLENTIFNGSNQLPPVIDMSVIDGFFFSTFIDRYSDDVWRNIFTNFTSCCNAKGKNRINRFRQICVTVDKR